MTQRNSPKLDTIASSPAPTDDEAVKVSVNLPKSVFSKVERLATARSLNRTSVIRQAIDLEDFIDSIVAKGGKILVKEGDGGDLKEVIFR